jgi:hypothetical protein
MHIINYTEGIFKDMSLKGADNAFCYATGLMTSQKSMVKVIEKLGLEISAKSFAESLRKLFKEADRANGGVLLRVGSFIDRRRTVSVIIDDTPDIRYGKKVVAAAYQHNNI